MKNIIFRNTITCLCLIIISSTIHAQSALDINYNSTASNPTALLSDAGKNNFTRLFFRNDFTSNEFRITTRAFAADLPDNTFNLSYYDGSTNNPFFKYSGELDAIALTANTIISNASTNLNPTLDLVEENDNNYTRLHFKNANNAIERFSVAANVGTTVANTIGFYYNGVGRLIYNEDDSQLSVTGITKITGGSSMTNPTLLLNETIDDNPSRIFFKNTNNPTEQWSLAAQNGSTSTPLIGFYYNSTPRVVYYESSSILEVTGDLDISETLNTTGNATFEGNVLFENFYQLEPLTVAPNCAAGGAHNGRVYFDDTTNKLRVCVNGSWDNLN